MTAPALASLVDGIYTAAYAPDEWAPFLESLTHALEATTAGFIFYARDCRAGGVSLYTGLGEEGVSEYVAHFAGRNEWMRHGARKLRAGQVHLSEELCPRETMRRSEFYNDWLRRHDIAEALGGCVFTGEDFFTNITILRPERRGPYSHEEVRLLGALMPHLQCAAEMHRRLAVAEQQAQATRNALDALPAPIFAVTATLEIVLANAAGLALLRDPDGLRAPGSRLEAPFPAEHAALRQLVANASAVGSGPDPAAAPGVARISRLFGRPLTVLVAPVPATYRALCDPGRTPAAILIVNDPDAARLPDPAALIEAFGLTEAEAAVAQILAAGGTIEAAARARRISTATVKVHLKRVFRRTGARSQADLVALLHGAPAR